MVPRKLGFKYVNGKVLIYKDNPGLEAPSWAVDIREILAIFFIGIGSICFIFTEQYQMAKEVLILLAGYVFGRTVPGGVTHYPPPSE